MVKFSWPCWGQASRLCRACSLSLPGESLLKGQAESKEMLNRLGDAVRVPDAKDIQCPNRSKSVVE